MNKEDSQKHHLLRFKEESLYDRAFFFDICFFVLKNFLSKSLINLYHLSASRHIFAANRENSLFPGED